jgi:hypothetical protein
MAAESEVIRKLRYQVDNYDEQQELLLGSDQLSKRMAPNPHQHVQLCSPDANQTTISAYNTSLHREHGITDFPKSLSSFFKRNNWEVDIYSYDVSFRFLCFPSYADRTDHFLSLMPSHL